MLSGPRLAVALPAPPLPGFSAGGFGACFQPCGPGQGAGLVGWENRLLLLVVALERLEEDEGTRAGGLASPLASGLVASALTISPRFYFHQNCGPRGFVAVPETHGLHPVCPQVPHLQRGRGEPLASRSLVPSLHGPDHQRLEHLHQRNIVYRDLKPRERAADDDGGGLPALLPPGPASLPSLPSPPPSASLPSPA